MQPGPGSWLAAADGVPADGSQQRQFPVRRIVARKVGAPDIAAGVADNHAIYQPVTICVGYGQRRGDAVDQASVLKYRG